MAEITIRGFLATTDVIPAYGVAVAPEILEEAIPLLRDGTLPMLASNDDRHVLRPRIAVVEMRTTTTGSLGIWVEFDIDEEEWGRYGDSKAFSAAFLQPQITPLSTDAKPTLSIGADAANFDDATREAAAAELSPYFAVQANRLYQFTEIPPAKLIIEFALLTLQALPANLIASVLFDSFKAHFLRPRHAPETVFSFRIRDGSRIIRAYLRTSNEDVLHAALATFQGLVLPEPRAEEFEYDTDGREWHESE
jgi:hypothetical protein